MIVLRSVNILNFPDFILSAIETPVNRLVREVIALADLRAAYDDGTDEGDGKLANLDEFIASVDEFARLNPTATLDEYLNSVTLASDLDEMDGGDYVTLATIHAVKGLEFKNVFICGLEEGIMPSSRAESDEKSTEEERRLMYVAITRARERLYLTRSKSRYLYGRRDLTAASKFIKELAPELGAAAYAGGDFGGYGGARGYGRSGGFGGGVSAGYSGAYRGGSGYNADEKSAGRALYSAYDGEQSAYAEKSSFKPVWGGSGAAKGVGGFGNAGGSGGNGGARYSVGMRVRHPKFGVGMVVAVKNDGKVINVAFDGQGVKELSAALAPLEII